MTFKQGDVVKVKGKGGTFRVWRYNEKNPDQIHLWSQEQQHVVVYEKDVVIPGKKKPKGGKRSRMVNSFVPCGVAIVIKDFGERVILE